MKYAFLFLVLIPRLLICQGKLPEYQADINKVAANFGSMKSYAFELEYVIRDAKSGAVKEREKGLLAKVGKSSIYQLALYDLITHDDISISLLKDQNMIIVDKAKKENIGLPQNNLIFEKIVKDVQLKITPDGKRLYSIKMKFGTIEKMDIQINPKEWLLDLYRIYYNPKRAESLKGDYTPIVEVIYKKLVKVPSIPLQSSFIKKQKGKFTLVGAYNKFQLIDNYSLK